MGMRFLKFTKHANFEVRLLSHLFADAVVQLNTQKYLTYMTVYIYNVIV